MTDPLRVVFVSFEYPPCFGGGIGTYVAVMSRILARRGSRVTIITVTDESLPRLEVGDAGEEIVRLPTHRGLPPRAEPMPALEHWQARTENVAAYLGKLCRAERIDVIEFPDYRAEGLAFLAGLRSMDPAQRPRCVVRLHTPLLVLNRYNRARARFAVLEQLEAEALRLADARVSPSAALAREIHAAAPDVGPIDLLPYPADPAVLDLARAGEDAGAPARSDDILYVGRLEERKGVETLIAAAPRLLAACPGARLRLVGADTEYGAGQPSVRARLERMVAAMDPHIAGRIIFEDALPREALLGRYRAARVCVFPSLFENFPNVCLEAMALGCVVVGSDNSGMAEMIEDGVSGVIARAGDAADLAEKTAAAWSMSEPARRAMGEAARRRIADAYDPDRIAAQWERVCAGRSDPAPPRAAPPSPTVVGRRSDTPRVAVVIPCFNHGAFVGEAVASARAQTWPGVEVVVVDDGSTDPATADALAELARGGVRVIRRDNGGLAAARNTGVRATDAEFFVPLDADDLIEPTFIERLIAPLLEDPTLGYVYSHTAYFGASGGVWACPEYNGHNLLVANQSVATAVVRRRAFDLAGGYAEDMRGGFEDWDFWVALLAVGYRGRCVPEPLFRYRQHAGGSMLTQTQRRRPELIRRMIEHHRWLYALNLEPALCEKDTMFFRAHMEAWETRQELSRLRGGAEVSPEIVVKAREELESILGSKAWRAVALAKANPLYRALARLRWGPGWEQGLALPPDPCLGLERIKTTRSYRVIRAVKSTGVYRMYASSLRGKRPT